MKVLISTDIEGVAGVFHAEQVRPGNGEYERARAWMTGEANAAIAGAIAGGAEEVLVNDSHGGFRNLLPDQLDERARLALSGHDGRARGVLRRGVHDRLPLALAGPRGAGAHDQQLRVRARLHQRHGAGRGRPVWRAGRRTGVPVALASGDDVFIAETRPLFPAAQWVQTKVAHGQGSGVTLTPAAARRAIAQAAETAVRNLDGLAPLRIAAPIECRLQTQGAALADLFCTWPTLERVDGVTLRFTVDSMQAAIRMLNSLAAMSFMLR